MPSPNAIYTSPINCRPTISISPYYIKALLAETTIEKGEIKQCLIDQMTTTSINSDLSGTVRIGRYCMYTTNLDGSYDIGMAFLDDFVPGEHLLFHPAKLKLGRYVLDDPDIAYIFMTKFYSGKSKVLFASLGLLSCIGPCKASGKDVIFCL